MRTLARGSAALALMAATACRAPVPLVPAPERRQDAYDVVIENARIVDGAGNSWFYGDLAIAGDRIARVSPPGALAQAPARQRVNARGLVAAPGFIDIQAQSYSNFMRGDGLAIAMLTQGITTAIMGEGETPAPVSERMLASVPDSSRERMRRFAGPRGFGQWLDFMATRGVAQNVGSYIGGGTVRTYAKGEAEGAATAAELDTMRAVVRRAMEDGAFGVASALIYPPNTYASTEELTEVARAMAPYGGTYITHMRSEGDRLLEAMDEALRIGRDAGVPVEIYHLKAAGVKNWPKARLAVAKIDSARRAGQDVQANMYLYVAGGNSFASCIPPEFSADGKLLENLRNPALRERIKAGLHDENPSYENLCLSATPANVMVVGFRRPELVPYEGRRLSEIAAAMGKDWADVIIDLNVAEEGQLGELLFLMDEANVRMQIQQPWMKFGTDAASQDPATARGMTHPRTYGNYPRLLGKYVREEGVTTLEDAVRKATSAVAARLFIADRGELKVGMKADVIVFDPNTIADRATFERPHQLSVGMKHVFVNGVEVLRDGVATGAKPGVVVRGPGWSGGARH
jgi:N-acyl-D-aspartate/D-glutamate deacylase